MKKLFKSIILITVLLSISSSYASIFDLIDANAQNITNTRALHAMRINIAKNADNTNKEYAKEEKESIIKRATEERDKYLKEATEKSLEANRSRSYPYKWNEEKQRSDALYETFTVAIQLKNDAYSARDTATTCWLFCKSTDTEHIANHVLINYRALSNTLRSRYNLIKNRHLVRMPLVDEVLQAHDQLVWDQEFLDSAKGTTKWIVSNPEGWTWEAQTKKVTKYAQAQVDLSQKLYDELKLKQLNLRKEKLADDLLGEQNKANAILDNTIALANDNYLKATEKTNINLKIALANAAIIVEDNLNSKWNQDQFTFNYQMPCSLEDTTSTAILIKSNSHKDKLELNEDNYYVYDNDISVIYPTLVEQCIIIATPKSGTNTELTDNEDLQVYRHWWMSQGTLNEKGNIVITEDQEINEIISLIKLAKEAIKKPVYLMYANHLNDELIDNNSTDLLFNETVEKVINKLEETNEESLVSGTMIINTVTKTYIKYSSDKDEIPITK
jgi:hypothetical protein